MSLSMMGAVFSQGGFYKGPVPVVAVAGPLHFVDSIIPHTASCCSFFPNATSDGHKDLEVALLLLVDLSDSGAAIT